jgi:formate-dependent nitrite reductase membrane component NrfD
MKIRFHPSFDNPVVTFMKRTTMIVLWTAGFIFLALVVSYVFGVAGVVIRRNGALTVGGWILHVLLVGIPLLGVVLGSLGWLPGTKRVSDHTA